MPPDSVDRLKAAVKSNSAACAVNLVFAKQKQFVQSGLRPENREIFSNPQFSLFHWKS